MMETQDTEDPVVEVISQHLPRTFPHRGMEMFTIACHCGWRKETKTRETASVLFGYHLAAELRKVEDHGAVLKALAKDLQDVSGRQAPKITNWPAAMEFIVRYGEQETP